MKTAQASRRAARTGRRAALLGISTAALLLASCGSTPNSARGGSTTTSQVPTTTSAPSTTAAPTTTTPPSCPTFGSTAATSGPSAVTRVPAVALLRNVQVQASDCADTVSFLFWGGTPAWSVSYRSGPLYLDPSGKKVQITGRAHLVIRLEPASGVDLSSSGAPLIYGGPTNMRPGAPSAVRQLRQLGDFEAVTTWAVGLDSKRPFSVSVTRDHLVVHLAAPAARVSRCEYSAAAVSVGYPARWYAELSPRWACQFFAPHPFVVIPNSDAYTWTVTVEQETAPAAQIVSQILEGSSHVVKSTTTVAGYKATVLDVTESGEGMSHAGWVHRMYVVATSPRALVIDGRPAPAHSALASFNRLAVDHFAAQLRRA